jgi:hypothetical protein
MPEILCKHVVTILLAYKINPLMPDNLLRRRTVRPLKIKIPSKNMRENPTTATIIHSVY